MNLFDANKQWAERPNDQRFWTLEEMHRVTRGHYEGARQTVVHMDALRVDYDDQENLLLSGPAGVPAKLCNWSFKQLANRVSAPAGYLQTLPADLAATCLNTGLRKQQDDKANVLFHQNGSLVCRAFTSDSYSRIWNYEVAERLLRLPEQGWRVPPARPATYGNPLARPATEADVLESKFGGGGLSVRIGDLIAPAGIYASDHDMFVFMVNEQNRVNDDTDGGLSRGFFVTNSEVGAAAFKITKFLYRHVCGNHIVWDVKDVEEIRIVHTGRNNERYGYQMVAELKKYANESAAGDEQRIAATKRFQIGQSKEDVLDTLFKLKVLPRKTLEAAYEHAVEEASLRTDVSPRSAWGFAQGITHMSQREDFAEDRVALDRAAGKVLSMAF